MRNTRRYTYSRPITESDPDFGAKNITVTGAAINEDGLELYINRLIGDDRIFADCRLSLQGASCCCLNDRNEAIASEDLLSLMDFLVSGCEVEELITDGHQKVLRIFADGKRNGRPFGCSLEFHYNQMTVAWNAEFDIIQGHRLRGRERYCA